MALVYPESISIETFRGCNARCIMCPVLDWAPPFGPMKNDVFTKIVDELSDFKEKLKSVALFGNGEPLLDKKLEERIAECKSAGLPNVGFTSNGSLISEKRASNIIESGPDWIVVSFDSLDKTAYEDIRLRLKLEDVVQGIERLIGSRSQNHSSTRIILRFIEQDKNRGQFEDYTAFWGPKLNPDFDEIHYGKEHNWAQGPEGSYGDTPCGFVFHKSYILRDGTICLCCTDFNAEYDFGNVADEPLLKLMNGAKWEEIRRIHAEGKRHTMELCNKCDIPELNKESMLSVKMTPSGEVFRTDTLTPFDHILAKSEAK